MLIGFGNMGHALAKGWLARGVAAKNISVVEPEAAAQTAARSLGVAVIGSEALAAHGADVVVVAVKPADVAASVAPLGKPARGCVILSIAAGKTTAELCKLLGPQTAVVRAMPNTPAAIGEGITAKAGMEQPLHSWVPSIAPSGMAFLTSDRYGFAMKGNLFVGSLKFGYLTRLELGDGKVLREHKLLEGGDRIRDVRQGPDGLLYLLTDSPRGQLLRLLP